MNWMSKRGNRNECEHVVSILYVFVIIERNAVLFLSEKKKVENEKCNLFIFIVSRRKAEMVACVLTAAQHVRYAQAHSSRRNVFEHAHACTSKCRFVCL